MDHREKGNFVHIVGTGPGDPELLTLKADSAIRNADVVLYDCQAVEPVLGRVPEGVVVRAIDRADVRKDLTFEEESPMLEAIREYYRKGLKVVRLKAGDPTLFGGADECDALDRSGIPYRIVPGICAGSAAASEHAIPISRKGESCVVINLIADDLAEDFQQLRDVARFLRMGFTMVLYMAKTRLADISRVLLEEQVPEGLPVLAACKSGRVDGVMAVSAVGSMCTDESFMRLDEPVVYVIGKYVRARTAVAVYRKHPELFEKCG